jgi:hypothetical protein
MSFPTSGINITISHIIETMFGNGLSFMLLLVMVQAIITPVLGLAKPIGKGIAHALTRPVNIVCPKIAKAVTYYMNNSKENMEVNTDKYGDSDTILRKNTTSYFSGLYSYGWCPFYVVNPNEVVSEADTSAKEKKGQNGPLMTIYFPKMFYGSKQIQGFFKMCETSYSNYFKNEVGQKIDHYEWSCENYSWNFIDSIPCRPETTIAGKIHKTVLQCVKKFQAEKNNYLDLHIPRKKTILLHGPPGTGKTTTVFLVASALGMPVFKMSMKDPKLSNDMLRNAARVILPGACVLIDDFRYDAIETFDTERQKIVNDAAGGLRIESTNKVDISCIYQLLDGGPASHRTTFFTTNNFKELIAALGEAFIRDGRIDDVFEIGYCSQEDIAEYYRVTMGVLVKEDKNGKDIERIRDAAKKNNPTLELNERMLFSPMTTKTIAYDLLLYLRNRPTQISSRLVDQIKAHTAVDLAPLLYLATSELPEKIERFATLDFTRGAMSVLAQEFANRAVTISEKVTMAKLQTVLITSRYHPLFMLDNVAVINQREGIGEDDEDDDIVNAEDVKSVYQDVLAPHLATEVGAVKEKKGNIRAPKML